LDEVKKKEGCLSSSAAKKEFNWAPRATHFSKKEGKERLDTFRDRKKKKNRGASILHQKQKRQKGGALCQIHGGKKKGGSFNFTLAPPLKEENETVSSSTDFLEKRKNAEQSDQNSPKKH